MCSFVKLRHPNDIEATREDILETLIKHYGEGVALADVLVAGTKIIRVTHIAQNLLSLQFLKWKESEKTADDVFTFLRLKNEENQPFRSPLFSQWVSFVELGHPNDNKAANEDILSTLTNNYREDAKLADVLVAGIEITNTERLAVKLLLIQLEKWLETGKTKEEVFTYLKLEELGEGLFGSPRFLLWVHFFGAYSLPNEYTAYRSA